MKDQEKIEISEMDVAFDIPTVQKKLKQVKRKFIFKIVVIVLVCLGIGGSVGFCGYRIVKRYQMREEMAQSFKNYQATDTYKRIPNVFAEYGGYVNGKSQDYVDVTTFTKIFPSGDYLVYDIQHMKDGIGSSGFYTYQQSTSVNTLVPESEFRRLKSNQASHTVTGSLGTTKINNSGTFYYPNGENNEEINELTKLNDYAENSQIEMVLSFDKGYTSKEIDAFLPTDLMPTFYWVDGYGGKELYNDLSGAVFGFSKKAPISDKLPENLKKVVREQTYFEDESAYVKALSQEKNVTFFTRGITTFGNSSVYGDENVAEVLAKHLKEKEGIIIGATVVGTPAQLKALVKVASIRGAVIATVLD